jgi:hypothetical protein
MANGTLKVSNIQTSSGSGTITLGQSGETITIASGASQTNIGTTDIDAFFSTSNQTFSSVNTWTQLATGYSRKTSNGFAFLGGQLTESSGTFSFPSTGIYEIQVYGYYYGNSVSSNYNYIDIYVTTDNSTYAGMGNTTSGGVYSGTNVRSGFALTTYVDVTDTSLVKFRIYGFVYDTGVYVDGITITAKKIGDT